jgi:hypothetical protein
LKPFEIQVPGEALFIPVEKMLLVCQEEMAFEGFFIDNRNQTGTFKRWKMEFHITLFPFVTGLGADDVGEFKWISRQRVINPERIRFIKEYTTHEVHYSGYLRGGILFGTWYLPEDENSFGRFAMWPKDYQKILETNMKRMTKSEKERNELEKKLVFVDIENSFDDDEFFFLDIEKPIAPLPKPIKRFGMTRQKTLTHIQVKCYFNQDYCGPLQLLSHFDYLQYQYFNESINQLIVLPNIDSVYLDLVVSAKQFHPNPFQKADSYSLLESFGVAVYLAESKVMEEIFQELISRKAPVMFFLQIFLFKQDYDLPGLFSLFLTSFRPKELHL